MARPKNQVNTLHRVCPTCKNEFTCEKRKQKIFCCKRCAANSPEVKEKNRKGVLFTFEKKYGGHPMAVNLETKENFKESMLEKHGVEYPSQMDDFVDKVKATKKERHGDENYNNIEKIKSTCLEKYGVDNYRKTDEYKEKYKETCLKKYGVIHSSLHPNRKEQINSSSFKHSHKLLMFKKFAASDKFKNFEPMFNIDEYDGITVAHNRLYKFRCKRCCNEHEYNLTRQYLRCPVCDKSMSTLQSEVVDYIKALLPSEPVITNNRTILSPLELDILIPNKNIAIETNGLYWHSEVSGNKDKNYHLNKTKLALAKGVRLIHISDDDWYNKPDSVRLILKNILVGADTTSKTLVVKEINSKEKKLFLEKYHLRGNDTSTVRLGLYEDMELIGVMTFTESKFGKDKYWEISRYCGVRGGANLLFDKFINTFNPKTVIAMCNRQYFTGETYIKMGFDFVKHTEPSYSYIIDGYQSTESKSNWQKTKLSKKLLSFDPALSEWENMKINGFDRIWDCGHSKWIYKA